MMIYNINIHHIAIYSKKEDIDTYYMYNTYQLLFSDG